MSSISAGNDASDFFGSIFGKKTSAQNAADNAARGKLDTAQGAYGDLLMPDLGPLDFEGPKGTPDVVTERAAPGQASAAGAGPSAMSGISLNPEYAKAQQVQMAALGNLAANGGRSATSDANLAAIQQQENANAKGQRDAIMQNMEARGMGGSGANLLAQLTSSGNAISNENARDLGVSAQEANTALGAGQGAAAIGSNLQNNQFNQQAQIAAANDAIAKFNAQNTTGVNEFNSGQNTAANQFNASQGNNVGLYNSQKNQGVNNASAAAGNQNELYNKYQVPEQGFENQMQKTSGIANAALGGVNYYSNQANIGAQQQGNILGSLSKLGAAGIAAAWKGGRTPGVAPVPGDSPLNDIVPVMSSPGEVHVPRTLAMTGTPNQIGSFVKHAPPINPNPAKDKEAMLAALKHLGRK